MEPGKGRLVCVRRSLAMGVNEPLAHGHPGLEFNRTPCLAESA